MQDEIILDDGVYFMELKANSPAKQEPGFLNRRCSTPPGFECIAGFSKSEVDDTWNVDIQTEYDPVTQSDCKQLFSGMTRLDAITHLWTCRQLVFCKSK